MVESDARMVNWLGMGKSLVEQLMGLGLGTLLELWLGSELGMGLGSDMGLRSILRLGTIMGIRLSMVSLSSRILC